MRFLCGSNAAETTAVAKYVCIETLASLLSKKYRKKKQNLKNLS
jgi:hypothetical protein